MTTPLDLIERCRVDYFLTGQREQRNVLATTIDASSNTFSFFHELKGIQEGAKISLILEDCYVFSVDEATKTASASRGDFGSTAAVHGSGTPIVVNAHISPAQIFRAMNDELASLSGEGLYRMSTLDLTYSPALSGYDMTSVGTVLDVYDVRADSPGPESDWPEINKWTLVQKMPTTGTHGFASGEGLILHEEGFAGRALRVRYRAPFTAMADATFASDDVATVTGLQPEAVDLLAIGAAVRLGAGREIKRSFTEAQGDTRRAAETPPGSALQSVRGLLALREQRLRAERRRLSLMFPPRMRV